MKSEKEIKDKKFEIMVMNYQNKNEFAEGFVRALDWVLE